MTDSSRKPAGPGPLFFLSYARPSTIERLVGDPDRDYISFYHDLCLALVRVAPLDRLHRLGAVSADREVDGPGADEQAARDIAGCDVFVPLHSPYYFEGEECGRELAAFQTRRRAPEPSASEAIIRVLWTPVDPRWYASQPPPEPTGDGEVDEVDEAYLAGGLFKLQASQPGDYRTIVDRLARRIIEVSAGRRLRRSEPVDPASLHSTLTPAERQPLSVVLLAPTSGHPPSATDVQYGATIAAWSPFAAESDRPLAESIAELAGDKGWRAEVRPLTVGDPVLSDGQQPDVPTVLVVDPRVLEDSGWRGVLERFDLLDKPWVGVAAAWDPRDDSDAEVLRLQDQLKTVLRRKFARRSPSLRLNAPIATSLRTLDLVLDATANDARIRLANRLLTRTRPSAEEESSP